jgi:hypothetical protein
MKTSTVARVERWSGNPIDFDVCVTMKAKQPLAGVCGIPPQHARAQRTLGLNSWSNDRWGLLCLKCCWNSLLAGFVQKHSKS